VGEPEAHEELAWMATNPRDKNITLKSRYLAVNFIGLAMIASVFVYAGVVEVIKWQWAPFAGFAQLPPQTAALLKYIFLAVAASQYAAIKVVQKILPAKSPDHLPQATIITFALCETVAVLGLVLFLLAGNSLDFYIFMVISLGYFYLFFPKFEQWEQLMNTAGPHRKIK
jgi:F0F1-type ATP synthase membrane subunit c/vacuolar-type H+-ATPase subunit K